MPLSPTDGVGELVAAQGQAGGAGIGAQELDLLTGLQRVVDAGVDRVGSSPIASWTTSPALST